ncbi:Xaa-Pro dipeptidase [Aidingimonas halophila]|uniref:Xaa-Pro dipeptidase n=1 Tax=Aidingimonas halophila TaxID=574349 RepID=A0A1H3BN75_9GAMM|nr:Xaa-Pro dipeptidase [Aidingimonas halophila]GHC26840.1 Xaa-Pro dipeptidase [Aidingimonas halophila]SDX43297.1 Xaa-Pro dipeptidase Metallo peptidase. MEROPS family M24B [Aidingimonas halophila]
MTNDLETAQYQHLERLQDGYERVLADQGYDGVLIYSGQAYTQYGDDQPVGFVTYGHFMHWIPMPEIEYSWILIRPGHRPLLRFHAPSDFWHLPQTLPNAAWVTAFDIDWSDNTAPPSLPKGHFALLGDIDGDTALSLGGDLNPAPLLLALDELRMYKDDFEIWCLREANRQALVGHQAAAEAFLAGKSELACHLAYLTASQQRESALPYPSIIALNRHAGVLHYQHYAVDSPTMRHSLLVDAGYRHQGYCADISRTTPGPGADERFSALLNAVSVLQQRLIDALRPGLPFSELHQTMHEGLGNLLSEHGIVRGSAEAAVEQGITRVFCPHGLGHSLGIQVHDVGGRVSSDGTPLPAPPSDPALRLTRYLESGMVVTIEPGLYFIPMLLDNLRAQPAGRTVEWNIVDPLISHGGIRIEDNLLITNEGHENLTCPGE